VKLPVRNAEGEEVRQLEVDDSVFGIEPNLAVLHQAFVAQRANQRWGTAQAKTRGEVQGSTRKIRMQKGTGRARQGSIRAPHHVGGGVAFGPRRRDYSQDLPKKMRRLAIRSALSGKAAHDQLVVIDRLDLERPKTQEILHILRNVGIDRSALIVTGQPQRTVLASARNLERTKVLPAAYLNVVDMLNHRDLLMTEEAVRVAEGLWGQKAARPVPPSEAEVGRRQPLEEEAVVVAAPTGEAAAREGEEIPAQPRRRRRAAGREEAPEGSVPEPKPRRRAHKAEAEEGA